MVKVVVTVTTNFFKVIFAYFHIKIPFFILWNVGKRFVFFLLPEAFCGHIQKMR